MAVAMAVGRGILQTKELTYKTEKVMPLTLDVRDIYCRVIKWKVVHGSLMDYR